jgi:hypothetical protein
LACDTAAEKWRPAVFVHNSGGRYVETRSWRGFPANL